MRARLVALTLCLAGLPGLAQEEDRLHSQACRKALDALRAQEAAATAASAPTGDASRRNTSARLQTLQRQAAAACLGGGRAGPASTRVAPPPVSVAPIGTVPLPTPPQVPPVSVGPVPPPQGITTVTACDVNGCLASDGTRLHWVGPNLMGPRGLCTVQGVTLQCPNP
jgi:hypothetical protein